MVVPAPQRPRFALDTNVLIDLGEGKPFAQRFLATFRGKGLAVPPTAVQELTRIATTDHPAKPFAWEALKNIRRWQILPYDLIPDLTDYRNNESGRSVCLSVEPVMDQG